MAWNIDFITREDFKEHVKKTIVYYGDKLESYDVNRFNKNIIDPTKMIFDKAVYGEDWETLISSEVFRQRDKSNTNEIGYFHQKIFGYIKDCIAPDVGQEGGWDVIFEPEGGYALFDGSKVRKIVVEVKNKHNTMNSSSAANTYIKMQNQLLHDDNCVCFLVEVIAKRSQNVIWETTIDRVRVSHNRIRRVSIDKFYEIVTGQFDAFYKICMALPEIVKEVISEHDEVDAPNDTVYEEIKRVADGFSGISENVSMILAMYMLGFSSYNGFDSLAESNSFLNS